MKKEIFSKMNRKDYNNQLEEILEKKDFSKDVKNLLLGILYKVEMCYSDYATVKRNIEPKAKFIHNILQNIEVCNQIILIKPQSEQSKELEKNHTQFFVDKEKKIIKVYPNEKAILYAINALDNKRRYLSEEYNLLRNALPDLLNEGRDINNVEIIRDFNAWSWNTSASEIDYPEYNLIYQILLILLGEDNLTVWLNAIKAKDDLNVLKEKLEESYGKKLTQKFLILIYKLAILLSISKNELEEKRLLEERTIIQEELEYMENKDNYLLDLSNKKKEKIEKIKKIDEILNDKKLFVQEFEKRNHNLTEDKKIFSLTHLSEILNKERKVTLREIEQMNQKLAPTYYIKQKEKLEQDFELVKDINDKEKQKELISQSLLELQKTFLKCFNKKIAIIDEKKEIVKLLYIFRYYLFIPYDKQRNVKDVKELKKDINKIKRNCIQKLYELKVINKITNQEKLNQEIIQSIFETKIICLENIVIELRRKEEQLEVVIFDTNMLETNYILPKKEYEWKKIKCNKKIKLFN